METSKKYSSIFIDSGNGWFSGEAGSSTYIAYGRPEIRFSSIGKQITISTDNDTNLLIADPLEVLDDYLDQGYTAVGYIGYEYSQYTTAGFVPIRKKHGNKYPDVNFLLYKDINPSPSNNYQELFNNLQLAENTQEFGLKAHYGYTPRICSNITKDQYIEMVKRGKSYIESGDVYQVNLSQSMSAELKLHPLRYFSKFYSIQPVPFGCYIDFGDYQLQSGSMELFLRKKGPKLVTNPIKGTSKRGKTGEIDTILKAKLIGSDKERAENLMIVDLMRNDLGKVSKTGTVKVNKLFDIESYTTLHQMVSEVESQVDENIKVSQILKATFPPGSVTGAPKRRTLEVIDELEPHLRGPYCGAIGIFYPNRDFTLSVAIRIMVSEGEKAIFYVGGGIVWDSDPEKEYTETLLKSKALTSAMGMEK